MSNKYLEKIASTDDILNAGVGAVGLNHLHNKWSNHE